jgi:hypothetical protein
VTPGQLTRAALARSWVVAGGLAGLAALVWLVPLQLGWYVRGNLGDVSLYREAAGRMASGELPYRDFALEYPPGAAGLFLAAWPWPGPYSVAFSGLMLAALIVTAVAVFATARALGFSDLRAALAGAAVAVAPLLLGSFVEARFDLALSAALSVALYGAVTRRFTIAWGALALGVLIKLVPLALIPVLLVYHAHVGGVRRAMVSAAASLGVVAAVFVPFLVAAPGGTLELLRYHLDRPLQIESAGAAALLALDQVGLLGLDVTTSFGSQNLVGAAPSVVAVLSSAVLVGLIATITVSLFVSLRGQSAPTDARLFVVAALATLIALLVAGKVLSPQFLVWLLPAAFLVPGPRGRWVAGLAGLAFVLTQAYFTALYWDLVDLSTGPVALLVLRDLTLVALLVVAWPRGMTARRAMPRHDMPARSLAFATPARDGA